MLEDLVSQGFVRARVDGEVVDMAEFLKRDEKLARYEQHKIEIIVDRLVRRDGIERRLTDSLETALKLADGVAEVELVARELSGYAKVSNAMVEDAGRGLEALLVTLFGGAIAWHEDMAFLRGDGVGKPLGAVGPATGAAVGVSRKTASRFVLDDAAKMLARMLPGWSPARTVLGCSCARPRVS